MKKYFTSVQGILTTIALLLSLTAIFFCYKNYGKTRIAFVVSVNLYNEFDYKKEVEKKYVEEVKRRESTLDSLYSELQGLYELQKQNGDKNNNKELDELKRKELEFNRKKQEILASNQKLARKYDEEIWKQLNQYIQDYSELSKFDIIFGAKGDGDILGAKKNLDITDDVILYVNDRFNGKK